MNVLMLLFQTGRLRLFHPGAILCLFATGSVYADSIRIAVASNFIAPMKQLAASFEDQTGHTVIIATGSTGKQYAHIRHGAPFDLFFAADKERPQRLEAAGLVQPGSRFTYALGRIALWSPQAHWFRDSTVLHQPDTFQHIAIANPKLAPYGRAARQVLQKLKLWSSLRNKIVRGENVAQAFQYIASGNAELGFVAYTQIHGLQEPGSYWLPPASDYESIEQQAVRLSTKPAAIAFMQWVQSPEAISIIQRFGYQTP